MSYKNKNKEPELNEDKRFDDYAEESERQEYYMFCSEFGPLYSRSYSFLILSILVFLFLSFFFKWFFIFIILNYMSWNINMQMDWDDFHGQLDDITDDDYRHEDLMFIFNPYLMFLYKKLGILGHHAAQLTKYCSYLLIYDKEKVNDDFFKVITKKKKKIYIKKREEFYHLIPQSKEKPLDNWLIKNYQYKSNITFRKDSIKDLYNANHTASTAIIKQYYNKENTSINYYNQKRLVNSAVAWVSFNNYLKKYYKNI